jgi:23S rRNA A2030 N6-methylase RlmJ
MANPYAANVGDVVKHLLLAEAILREAPSRYVESHGGRLDYPLRELDPGRGGIGDFLEVAGGAPLLDRSAYARLARGLAGPSGTDGTYPGSIAIAAELLPPGAGVVAFDLVETSAASLRDGLAARGRPATVVVGDGVAGALERAAAGDVVFLDPFFVTEAGPAGVDSADAFAELAGRGVATLLWYGAGNGPEERIDWTQDIRDRVGPSPWRVEFGFPDLAGGLACCGVLAVNLAPETEASLEWLAFALAGALQEKVDGLTVEIARTGDRAAPIWSPYGARRASAADVRRLIISVGFPFAVVAESGETVVPHAAAETTWVSADPGGAVTLRCGGWSVAVGMVRDDRIVDTAGSGLVVRRAS